MYFNNNMYSIMQNILFYAITPTGETTTSTDKKGNNSITIIAVAVSVGFLLLITIIIVLAVCRVKRRSVQRCVSNTYEYAEDIEGGSEDAPNEYEFADDIEGGSEDAPNEYEFADDVEANPDGVSNVYDDTEDSSGPAHNLYGDADDLAADPQSEGGPVHAPNAYEVTERANTEDAAAVADSRWQTDQLTQSTATLAEEAQVSC
ncbi:hypothetical protein EB796_020568 [Bugula neritina]|uniref:Uncharacterized protein n=1 Tax=Bugula neritina TaxID=10212 RepID=A0A7J7J5X5_BUGNE|nr:hypothetical protein EB796_020568 [Bugula neritina]